ncbi:MAG: hypothetical protein A2V66_11375 [Ignavibacteria bacterium RBG_13_36_8]|nr:MAG: hypothetical protein A2V66_11375 [Ignavibacteria bacterium RBG_13_36_8]
MKEKKDKKKLLIIEDDSESLRFLQAYLRRYFEVSTCDSDEAFYEKMERENFDIILMDISIKGKKNGLELTREIKQSPRFTKIPVICYTAHALQKDRVNAIKAGCDLFLSKPIDNKILLNSLFDFLDIQPGTT